MSLPKVVPPKVVPMDLSDDKEEVKVAQNTLSSKAALPPKSESKEEVKTTLSLDDEEEKKPMFTLISGDGKYKVKVPINAVKAQSGLVRNALEDDKDATELVLSQVPGETLKIIGDFIIKAEETKFDKIERPARSKKIEVVFPKNDMRIDFVKKNFQVDEKKRLPRNLQDVILASNYMNVSALLEAGCSWVAMNIKGIPTDQIQTILSNFKAYSVSKK